MIFKGVTRLVSLTVNSGNESDKKARRVSHATSCASETTTQNVLQLNDTSTMTHQTRKLISINQMWSAWLQKRQQSSFYSSISRTYTSIAGSFVMTLMTFNFCNDFLVTNEWVLMGVQCFFLSPWLTSLNVMQFSILNSQLFLLLLRVLIHRPKSKDDEDFYFTDLEDDDEAIEMDATNTTPPLPPTLSHSDMARPPHEDPEYQRKIVGNIRQGLLMSSASGQTFVKAPMSGSNSVIHNYAAWSQTSPVRRKYFWFCWTYFTDFDVNLDVTTEARTIVAKTVHIVCSISIANILHSQLSNFGSTLSFNAIITRINHKIIS